MSFPKLALALSFTGLLAGLAVSLLVTPRFTSTATMVLKDANDDADTREMHGKLLEGVRNSIAQIQSGEWLTAMTEDSRPFDLARQRIQISFENGGAQSFRILRIRTTGRDRRSAMTLASAVITYLLRGNNIQLRDLSAEKDRTFRGRIQELRTRLAALEVRAGVPLHQRDKTVFVEPTAFGGVTPVSFEVLDAPTVPQYGYPNRWPFMLTGAAIGFLLVPLVHANSRRRGRAAHGRTAQAGPQ